MTPVAHDDKERITLVITSQTQEHLRLMAHRRKTSVSEIVRQAIREYLEAQEDLIGSRSRLGHTVMAELEATRNKLVRQLNHMSALLLAAIILQQIQRGEPGNRIMDQINHLAGQIEQHLSEGDR